jgi:hypothetical protein
MHKRAREIRKIAGRVDFVSRRSDGADLPRPRCDRNKDVDKDHSRMANREGIP